MEIRPVITYPLKLIKRTWLGDFAKLVRIAYTPLRDKPLRGLQTDCSVPAFRKPNLLEEKAGMKRITTTRRIRELRKRLFSHDFCP